MLESENHKLFTSTGRERKRTQLEFRIALAHKLLLDYSPKRRLTETKPLDVPFTHWPSKMPKARCKLCLDRGERHEPRMGCKSCFANLCVECFKPYHMEKYPAMFASE